MLTACQLDASVTTPITKAEMLQIAKKCDQKFSIGIQKRDSAFLSEIYSDSAQYVQPNSDILKGKKEISRDWGGFIRLKQKPIDLILNISEVRGTREIIYETGSGYTLLADSTKWNFNYVNVWRLQTDGSYKLEIDTYTPLDK
jgi:ketosteroid isomerase-like protein